MRTRRRRASLAATALVAIVAAGCGTAGDTSAGAGERTASGPTTSRTPSTSGAGQEAPVRIRLTIGDDDATVTLEDNAAARDLAAMLPVTVALRDHAGSEKAGPLPTALSTDAPRIGTYRIGQFAYWPPDRNLFVVYAGDGLPVPGSGLILLGTVDDGLDVVTAAGDDADMTLTAIHR